MFPKPSVQTLLVVIVLNDDTDEEKLAKARNAQFSVDVYVNGKAISYDTAGRAVAVVVSTEHSFLDSKDLLASYHSVSRVLIARCSNCINYPSPLSNQQQVSNSTSGITLETSKI